MSKKLWLVMILMLIIPGLAQAENIKVNNKEIEQGGSVNLFFDDLEAGKIDFGVKAGDYKSVEVSFDKGRTWENMDRDGEYFVYSYRPLSEEKIIPEFIYTSQSGKIETISPNITVLYRKDKPEEGIRQALEILKTHYENEDVDRFVNLFSSIYPDLIKFKESIQNDFYNYKNIRLFYRIDRMDFNDDINGAIVDVYWQRKFEDRDGNALTDTTANITMKFDNENGKWLISGLRGNTLFGSSLLSSVDLEVQAADINITDGGGGSGAVTVSATVHNTGSSNATNVKVNFYQSGVALAGPYTLIDSKTITSVPAGSQTTSATVNFASTPAFIWYFKIVVDPDSVITETDETNNTASTTHTLP